MARTLRLRAELDEEIKAIAVAQRRSEHAVIERALEQYVASRRHASRVGEIMQDELPRWQPLFDRLADS